MSSYLCMPSGLSLDPTTVNSANILKDKTAYDGEGNLLTGSMRNNGRWPNADKTTFEGSKICMYKSDGYTEGGLGADGSTFGNASASDVRSGVTFTSSNGLNLTGTMPNGSKLIGALSGVSGGSDKAYSYIASSEYFDGSKFLKSCNINIQAFLAYTLYDHAALNLNGSMIFGRVGDPTSGTFNFNQNYNVSANQTLNVQVWGNYFDVLFAKVYLV